MQTSNIKHQTLKLKDIRTSGSPDRVIRKSGCPGKPISSSQYPDNRMAILVCVFYFLFFIFDFASAQAPTGEARVSLHFREVEIKNALFQLAKEANLNLIGGEEIEGRITVSFENLPLSEALSSLLRGTGYAYEMEGKEVLRIVLSSAPPKRIEVAPGIFAQTFIVNYTEPENIKEAITPFLPENAKIIIPKGTKTLLIQGKIPLLKNARKLIRAIDLPPKQVMVEARIMEVTHSTGNIQGVSLNYANPRDPTDYAKTVGLTSKPTDSSAQGLFLSVTSMSLEALMETFRQRTGYNLLSSPRVLAIEGKKAELITGQRLGYKTKTVTTTGLIESIEFMDVGTKLTIQPSIKEDDTIIMEVHPEVSTGSIVNELPQKDSTETTTTLSVKDGQTIIIGGLLRDYVQEVVKGVPILMDLPFLGTFFRRTVADTQKREIIVLINPRIIDIEEIARSAQHYDALEALRKKATEYSPLQLVR